MKTGFVLPGGDARLAAELAYEAELAGWDSFFVWEPVWGVDAWVCLTAAAMRTQRIRLGTMLSPLSRMRPWKLASESGHAGRLARRGRNLVAGDHVGRNLQRSRDRQNAPAHPPGPARNLSGRWRASRCRGLPG